MKSITVRAASGTSRIHIHVGVFKQLGTEVRKVFSGAQIVLISDAQVARRYRKPAESSLKRAGFKVVTLVIPAGESNKTVQTASRLWGEMIRSQIHRDHAVVALGGGVVGDIAGFVASTYMRGIPVIQIPTSLIAQVDSAIGGKTGVDHPLGKNMIGAFHQPVLVLIDPLLLGTLPPREVRGGLAEIVKYGIIGDPHFFRYLEKHVPLLRSGKVRAADIKIWEHLIAVSASAKAKVVSLDEKEGGLRRILNFGHTLGHAIETAGGYKALRHGEAISIGMAAASRMATRLGLLHPGEGLRIEMILDHLGLPIRLKGVNITKVMALIKHDKKVKAGRVHFVLPYRIGNVIVRGDIPLSLVKSCLESVTDD